VTTTHTSATVDAIDPALVHRLVDKIVARPRAQREVTVAPFTGKPLAELPISTPADVEAAYRAAALAQTRWAARPVEERARIVGRIHDLILDRQSEVADLVQMESGKARRDAFEEIGDVALAARYAASRGPRLLRDRRRLGFVPGLTWAVEARQPKGVVGVISPWNYPLTLAISDNLPAFVAGNAVVHKPDIQAVLTALLARSIAVEAGLPEALWQIVVGRLPGGSVSGWWVLRSSSAARTRCSCSTTPTSVVRPRVPSGRASPTPGSSAYRWSGSTWRPRFAMSSRTGSWSGSGR